MGDDSEIGISGNATLKQVARAWLKSAMQEEDPYESHRKLRKFIEFKNTLGWTLAQVKNHLELTDEQYDLISNRYSYLHPSEATLELYNTIRISDEHRLEL